MLSNPLFHKVIPGSTRDNHIPACGDAPCAMKICVPLSKKYRKCSDLAVYAIWSGALSAAIATHRRPHETPDNARRILPEERRPLCRGPRPDPHQPHPQEFATLPEAQAYGATIGDGRTMIYAVTTLGHSAHIINA